jgi:kynurenine formamidase
MIIDLSVTLSDDLPCDWPGMPRFSASVTSSFESGDVFSRSLVIEEHCGTHADAPNHIALGDEFSVRPIGIDAMSMDRFCGPARVADLRHVTGDTKGESPWITPEDLDAALDAPLQAGDVLLINTGWSDERYQSFPAGERYVAAPLAGTEPGWPALHPFTVERAAYAGVRLIGVDTPSLGATHDPLPAHRAALGRGIAVVENLIRLADVPDKSLFMFFPLKVAQGSGAPGRAIAITTDAVAS